MASPILDYSIELAACSEKIRSDVISRAERQRGVQAAADYYNHIASQGMQYGKAALNILCNRGLFGEVANGLLRAGIEKAHPHWDSTEVHDERDNVVVLLAASDSSLRKKKIHVQTSYIADYHYKIFNERNIQKEYWGGSFFEEHVASGSYMALYTGDLGILSLDLIVNAARNVALDRKINGIGARAAVRNLLALFSVRRDANLPVNPASRHTIDILPQNL